MTKNLRIMVHSTFEKYIKGLTVKGEKLAQKLELGKNADKTKGDY